MSDKNKNNNSYFSIIIGVLIGQKISGCSQLSLIEIITMSLITFFIALLIDYIFDKINKRS